MSYKVILPYDPIWKPLPWAIAYCKSYITNSEYRLPNNIVVGDKIVYYFSDEADAILFSLYWSDTKPY